MGLDFWVFLILQNCPVKKIKILVIILYFELKIIFCNNVLVKVDLEDSFCRK